jgi:uncharacterized protein YjbI with pentapeptide repeats
MHISNQYISTPTTQVNKLYFNEENSGKLEELLRQTANVRGEIAIKESELSIKPKSGLLSKLLQCCRPGGTRMAGGNYFGQHHNVSATKAHQLIREELTRRGITPNLGTNTSIQPSTQFGKAPPSNSKQIINLNHEQPKESRNLIFTNKSFIGTALSKVDFSGSLFDNIDFKNANCKGAAFKNCHFKNVAFAYTELADANFDGATFENVKITPELRDITRADWQKMLPVLKTIDSVDVKYPDIRKNLIEQWFTRAKKIGVDEKSGLADAVKNFPGTQGTDAIATKAFEQYSILKIADITTNCFTEEPAENKAKIIKAIEARSKTHDSVCISGGALYHLPRDPSFLHNDELLSATAGDYFGSSLSSPRFKKIALLDSYNSYGTQPDIHACKLSLEASRLHKHNKEYHYNPPSPYQGQNLIIDNRDTVKIDARLPIHNVLITNSSFELTGDGASCNNLAVKNSPNSSKYIDLNSKDSVFKEIEFSNAIMIGSAQKTTFDKCTFANTRMIEAQLERATFKDTKFIQCKLDANLAHAKLDNIILRAGDLSMAHLEGATITLNLDAIQNGGDVSDTLAPIMTIKQDPLRNKLVEDVRDRVKVLTSGADPELMNAIDEGFEQMLRPGDHYNEAPNDIDLWIDNAMKSIIQN